MFFSIPLAWLQLIHKKFRFLGTVASLAFIVNLLFLQLGLHDALFESSLRVYKALQGDLFIISSQYQSLTSQQPFPRTRLYQALAVDGVETISPLYVRYAKLKNIDNGYKFSIVVFGIDPGKPTFNLKEVQENLHKLKIINQVLFDQDSRSEFGPIAERFNQGLTVSLELAGYNEITIAKSFQVAGLYSIGTSFGIDGSIIANYTDSLLAFPGADIQNITLGLIILKPEADPQIILNILRLNLPNDIKILTREELFNVEKTYWSQRTPIGFSLNMMLIMAFIIGMGVIFEVLDSNVASNLKEYAALKAMGYTHQYLVKIVFQQALIIATFSYLLGFFVSLPLYKISREITHLPIIMTIAKCLFVLNIIIIMCVLAGILAIGKTRGADPAELL